MTTIYLLDENDSILEVYDSYEQSHIAYIMMTWLRIYNPIVSFKIL